MVPVKVGHAAGKRAAAILVLAAIAGCSEEAEPPAPRMISFISATVGDSCAGELGPYLVLSEGPADCLAHARALRRLDLGTSRTEAVLFASLPQTSGEVTVNASVCPVERSCETTPVTIVFDTWVDGSAASGSYAFAFEGVDVRGDFAASGCEYDQFVPAPRPFAGDIAVQAVKVLQGTSVTIAESGAPVVERNAPVVETRPALLRVFVEPDAAYTARDIIATLTLQRSGQRPTVLEQTLSISTTSADNDIDTTINFQLEASQVTTDTQWRVSLNEVERCAEEAGNTTRTEIPRDGSMSALNAQSMGGTFNVVVVPFRYTFDGSGRLPDTSPDQIERFRDRMYAKYPISELSLTVREPFDYGRRLRPRSGEDWTGMLDTLWALRANDAASATTYYYGLVAPTDSPADFCSEGCIEGVSSVPNASDSYSRGAMGLGFSGRNAEVVFTHEMGHAAGLDHAPCPPGRIFELDPEYPYDAGRIGVTGYDISSGRLLSATRHRDIMSYCDPQWVSDYTFSAIFDRLRRINNAAFGLQTQRNVRAAIAGANGASWGHQASLRSPVSRPVEIRLEGPTGQLIAVEVADQMKVSDSDVTIYWIPDVSPSGAVRVRLPDGQTLPL